MQMIVFSAFISRLTSLYGLDTANDFGYAGQVFEGSRFNRAGVAGDADGSALGARQGVRAQTEVGNRLANRLDLLFGCMSLHYD